MNLDALLSAVRIAPTLAERVAAADALGAMKNAKAVGHLMACLRDGLPELKAAACEALGLIADARAVPALVSMLRDDAEEVRGEALAALISIGQQRASALPVELLSGEDPRNPSVQATQIVWPADLEAIKLLDESLGDEDPEVRIGASYALGKLGMMGAHEHLAWLLLNDPDDDVRAAAGFALGDLGLAGDARAGATLVGAWPAVRDRPESAVTVVRALVEVAPQSAFFVFEQALSHPDDRVRQLACIGLGRSGDPAAPLRLAMALRDAHTGVRRNAAAALGFAGDASVSGRLVNAVAGEDAEVRASLGDALGRLARIDAAAVRGAIDLAAVDADPGHRAAAAYLLGRMHTEVRDPHWVGAGLSRGLADPDGLVRKSAALAIGSCAARAFRPTLEGALDDPEWQVRVAAAEGLRRIGDAAALAALDQHEHDEHPVVRNAIANAQAALRAPR